MEKIKVVVIGSTGRGDFGHGLDVAWKAVPECEVVAVADDDAAGLKAAQKRTGATRAYADYREMLDRERPTIAAVALRWIDRHRDIALACAEHGCHMYMEKPFCRTLEEADEIVRACEMRHVKIAIAHISRYSPVLAVVRKLIAAGEIGDVLEIRTRGKEDRRGGAEDLWVLGSHVLDMMHAVAGSPPTSCFATLERDGKPVERKDVRAGNEGLGPLAGDRVEARFRFPSGIVGYFSSRAKAGGNPSRFGVRILGAKGVIDLAMGYGLPAYLLKDPGWGAAGSSAKWQRVTSQGIDKPESSAAVGYEAGNPAAIRDLIEAIRADRAPVCGLTEGRSVVEMILACFESHRLKKPVELPLVNRKHPLSML
jgi:predicted dehydrogenase